MIYLCGLCIVLAGCTGPCILVHLALELRRPQLGAYNIWDGFAVERYTPAPLRPINYESEAVAFFLDFVSTLCNNNKRLVKYVLDWVAQIFQNPALKTGVAPLLKGEEGVGKNRFTDLIRAMLRDKFLQTATPSTTLYGRFTRQREGKLLIVINESSGPDNFAANDIIKDMITCDEFLSEGKGTNAYTMNCYANQQRQLLEGESRQQALCGDASVFRAQG